MLLLLIVVFIFVIPVLVFSVKEENQKDPNHGRYNNPNSEASNLGLGCFVSFGVFMIFLYFLYILGSALM